MTALEALLKKLDQLASEAVKAGHYGLALKAIKAKTEAMFTAGLTPEPGR